MSGKTGWPQGLLQDDCRALSRWFAGRLGARRALRDTMQSPCWWLIDWPEWVEQFEPETDENQESKE